MIDGTMIVSRVDEPGQRFASLWRLGPGDRPDELLRLSDPSGCRYVEYDALTRLDDGRLGLARTCANPDLHAPVLDREEFVAVDLADQTVEVLAPLAPVERRTWDSGNLQQDFRTGTVDWQIEAEQGLVTVGASCATIAELTSDGVAPLDVDVGEGSQRWNLAETVENSPSLPCTDRGRAFIPVWSPNGERLLYFASPASVGVEGPPDRFSQPSNLYLADRDLTNGVTVLDDIAFPTGVEWLPDGRRAVVSGELDGREGVWTIEVDSGDLVQVSDQGLASLAVSPSGREVAGILSGRATGDQDRIIVLDVPSR